MGRRVAALVAGVVLLAGCAAGSASQAARGQLHWERIVVSASDWEVIGLAADAGRILALVYGEPSSVWSSTDGYTWQRAAQFEDGDHPADLVRVRNGFIVVGSTETGAGWETEPAVWTSADGQSWARDIVDLGSPVSLDRLAVGSDGTIVAMGSCIDQKPLTGERICGAYLTEEGEWQRAETSEGEGGNLMAVAAGGPGFVAVGQLRLDGQPRTGAMWTSTDGRTWQLGERGALFTDVILYGVAERDGSLAVVGARLNLPTIDPVAWTAPDGVTWTEITGPEPLPATEAGSASESVYAAMYTDVAYTPDGALLAVGAEGAWDDPDATRLLMTVSTDGGAWTRVADVASGVPPDSDAGSMGLQVVIAAGDQMIVGGGYQGASVWIGESD